MFWTMDKLNARIAELSSYRYRDAVPISGFQCATDADGVPGHRPPDKMDEFTLQIGDRWQGRDLYLWLECTVQVPSAWDGRTIVGRFNFGTSGGGNNSGFESLAFVEGVPYQGVDSHHQEIFLSSEMAGRSIKLQFRLWSGLEGGGRPTVQEHVLHQAELTWLDEDTDDLYFTGKATLDTVRILPEESPDRVELLNVLDRAFRLLDWSMPGSDRFYASVQEARSELNQKLNEIERKSNPVTVNCIGHTHIDVAWLWRLKHTREKSARSFSTVLRLMERFPEYIFLQTQPQLYDYLKQDYPELYEQIRQRVAEGRWEVDGAMWLEADCNLSSGESLVRQILQGTRFFQQEFGQECKFLWLPDVFGYSWALPQILVKSGIHTFMTTKISWNQYNRMPHDTFIWRGMDGSEVLAHFITTPEPNNTGRWWYTYNGNITPGTVSGIWTAYRDKAVNRQLLLSYGYGDGGGGVNREMLEMRRRLEHMPGLPRVRTSRADEFFEQLHETFEHPDGYVHTWDGELYLEYHRGTYTSQAYNKRMNRKLELKYRETEWLALTDVLLHSDWTRYAQNVLNEGWKIILRNQFHDILPGSSIHEVYQDSREEYQQAWEMAEDMWYTAAQHMLSTSKDSYMVFNSASWGRMGRVVLPCIEKVSGVWVDSNGTVLAAQYSRDGWIVEAQFPTLGFTALRFMPAQETPAQETVISPFEVQPRRLVTPFYIVDWNELGQFVHLYDREAQREVFAEGKRGNVLQVFEDKPLRFDAWDIDLFYQEKMEEVQELQGFEVVENGPLQVVYRATWTYGDSSISQDIVFYAHSREIEFRTLIDWQQRQQLLKVAFPVAIRATQATYDIQFGNVKRPTHWNTSWDQARFETVAHQWVDLSEYGYGVSLLNDSKYGHDIKDNVMRMSLIKSAIHPDVEADQGEHQLTYALYPHVGDWLEGGTVTAAWEINNPLTFAVGTSVLPKFSLFHITGGHVMVDAVKKAEDEEAVVLRLHDYSGGCDRVSITSDLELASWQECDLRERWVGPLHIKEPFEFAVSSYEIKTFIIKLSSS